jgi:hypothetical protein
MRTNARRTDKYAKKVRGLVLPGQAYRFGSQVGRQVEIEQIVNSIVGSDINRVYYMIFGKEVWKKMCTHTGGTLDTEVGTVEDRWTARGLDMGILDRIEDALNYRITYRHFILDESGLDGEDRLA